ncbi:cytochrome P450 4V2 [Podospora conica]|nr:cytochrome P450 4V2 [Schizothecium conicum]
MGLPYVSISAVSLGAGYVLSTGRVSQLPQYGFFAVFASTWAALLLSWVTYTVILYPKLLSPLRHLPEPSGNSWWAGQFPTIRRDPTGVPQLNWINSVPNDGVIRYLGLFNEERLFITSPKALAEVLTIKNYDFEKPRVLRFFLGRILGIGLFFAEGDEHKSQRRKLMPAFAFRHVKDLYPTFWSKSQELVQGMTDVILSGKGDAESETPEDGTVVVEVGAWASRATLDIIGVAGLGRDFGALKDPNNKLSRTYNTVFQPNRQNAILGVLNLLLPSGVLDKIPMKRNNVIHEATGVIRSTCHELIQEKKVKLARKEQTADVDILSVALESGGFTDENLVDQMMTFLLAGHETTASSMTWAAYLLAKHPDIQARLRDEVRACLPSVGDTATTVSSLDIDRMPYLNAFCSEVFRYFPPAALLSRDAARATSIQGHYVPKGTRIILCPWAVNRSESIWGPDAGVFNPDRWLGGAAAPNAYGMMTFLHGPRACIGRDFARAEFACLMAAWAGRFSFELHNKEEMDESKVDMQGALITRPVKGMYIKMKVVEGW